MADEVKSSAGYLGYKGPSGSQTSTTSSNSSALDSYVQGLGYANYADFLSQNQLGANQQSSGKTPKSGTYVRTYDSSSVPDELALKDKVNKKTKSKK